MPNAYAPDLVTATSQLTPFIQSLSGKIPVFGRASKAEKNLHRVATSLQKVEAVIIKYEKLEQLPLNDLLMLMFKNLGKIQKQPHFFMRAPQTGTEELLELMNDILSAKPPQKPKELNKLIKKITKLQAQMESASSGLRYGGKISDFSRIRSHWLLLRYDIPRLDDDDNSGRSCNRNFPFIHKHYFWYNYRISRRNDVIHHG